MRSVRRVLLACAILICPISAGAEFGEPTLVKHPGFRLQEGPGKAKGVILWSPGFDTRTRTHSKAETGEMPHFLDWLYGDRWDVYYMERRGGTRDTDRPRHMAALRNAVKGLREAGYRNIVLAGQSSGGTYTLLAASEDLGLYALLLTSSGPSQGTPTFSTLLRRAKARRIAVTHFASDETIGQRPKREIASILSSKRIPALNIFEPQGIEGHSGSFQSTFSKRFGDCILLFLEPTRAATGENAMDAKVT